MDYFIPKHMSGRFATAAQRAAAVEAGRDPDAVGLPYEFFRGIHDIPDALADSHHANTLGIVPVEEMTDEDWRLLGLDKDGWMKAHRSQPDAESDAEAKDESTAPDHPQDPTDSKGISAPV